MAFKTLLSTVGLSAAVAAALPTTASAQSQIETVHQFPDGTFVENLAVRKNGAILLSVIGTPETLYIDPQVDPDAVYTVASYPMPASAALGISELGDDIFYTATSSFDFSCDCARTKGTGQIWKLNLTQYDGCSNETAPKELIATLPESQLLNGLTTIPNTDIILVADSILGLVWRVNVSSAEVDVSINDTLTAASVAGGLGVNGLKYRDNYLYLTNTNTSTYARVPIDMAGLPTGDGETLLTAVAGDDFTLAAAAPGAYIAAGFSNYVAYVSGENETDMVNVGSIAGPTSLAFGRTDIDASTLYITSTGGDSAYANPPVLVGGTLSKLVL